jgi:hypothetical protein
VIKPGYQLDRIVLPSTVFHSRFSDSRQSSSLTIPIGTPSCLCFMANPDLAAEAAMFPFDAAETADQLSFFVTALDMRPPRSMISVSQDLRGP